MPYLFIKTNFVLIKCLKISFALSYHLIYYKLKVDMKLFIEFIKLIEDVLTVQIYIIIGTLLKKEQWPFYLKEGEGLQNPKFFTCSKQL